MRDGYVRPVPGADLMRIELGTAFESTEERPYERLANMMRPDGPVMGAVTTSDRDHAIAEWCRSYGLLGVLFHGLEMVFFPPVAESADDLLGPLVTQTHLLRIPKGTLQQVSKTTDESSPGLPPGVLWRPLGSADVHFASIEETWAQFFPGVDADVYGSLDPRQGRFWEVYQEPVDDFVSAAETLADALWMLGQPRPRSGISPLIDDHALAVHTLNDLADQARWMVEPTRDRKFVERWVTPTPLSALAMLALRDLVRRRALRICANDTCRNLFGSVAYQARYCSPRCRHTVNKRTVRRNRREQEKREQRAGKRRPRTKRRGRT